MAKKKQKTIIPEVTPNIGMRVEIRNLIPDPVDDSAKFPADATKAEMAGILQKEFGQKIALAITEVLNSDDELYWESDRMNFVVTTFDPDVKKVL